MGPTHGERRLGTLLALDPWQVEPAHLFCLADAVNFCQFLSNSYKFDLAEETAGTQDTEAVDTSGHRKKHTSDRPLEALHTYDVEVTWPMPEPL